MKKKSKKVWVGYVPDFWKEQFSIAFGAKGDYSIKKYPQETTDVKIHIIVEEIS